ncbi:MAG: proton-conducting transporter membrane subunit [Aestuariivita sp.]|nr:proton-conducting transporter membrane subunit [Aestuariivita sp.]
MTDFLLLLPLLAPILLISVSFWALWNPSHRICRLPQLIERTAIVTIAINLFSIIFLFSNGPDSSALIGVMGIGFSIRLDAVSAIMGLLVSFVGWIVVRYSINYMDGEPRQGHYSIWLSVTLAAVFLIIWSGNLTQLLFAWILANIAIHRLLLYFSTRRAAKRAARKRAVTARVSEISLLTAIIFLVVSYESTDIATILAAVTPSLSTIVASLFIAIAAAFASAQFPIHGWLTEVMEAPTPVSALLHAGVINAGGFFMIRFAEVLLAAPLVMALLVMIGGFSALFGGLVMLTQPTVKTSLAWSTIAQMGFMVLQCGLALFSLALLHIVAHSLYKAHAFLSAGETVENVMSVKRLGPIAVPSLGKVLRAFAVAIIIFCLVGFSFGFENKSIQSIALGVILIFGVAYLLAQGFADTAPAALTRRTAIYATATSVSYFILQWIAEVLTLDVLPNPPTPGPLEWALIVLALVSFGAVAVAQSTFPLWAGHPAAAGLRIHLSNGLYINALFDRLLGGWSVNSHKT